MDIRLGILSNKRHSLYFTSVRRVREETLRTLQSIFPSIVFEISDYVGMAYDQIDAAYTRFLKKVDVVFKLPGTGGFFGKRDNAIPLVLFALGSMPRGAFSLARARPKLRNIDSLIFSCEADRQIFCRLFEKGMMNELVVPFGVNCDYFKPLSPSESVQIRKRFRIPAGSHLLLYTGRVNIQKNIHILLKLFAEICRYDQQCYLALVGEEDDTDFLEFNVRNKGYTRYLANLMKKYDISDRIIMPGKLEDKDLRALYAAADVFVNCTIHHDENFGFSQVEAMACGVPVVCTKWGGLKDTIINGKTGFYMETLLTNNGINVDWQSGVSAILDLLRNPSLRLDMSRQCLDYVRRHLSLDQFAMNLEYAITQTVEAKKKLIAVRRGDTFGSHPYGVALWKTLARREKEATDPLYEGDMYKIYRFLIEPYTSRNINSFDFTENSVPYFLIDVEFKRQSGRLKVQDPIWPRDYPLEEWQYEVLSKIDGKSTVGYICAAVKAERTGILDREMEALLNCFCREGVVYPHSAAKPQPKNQAQSKSERILQIPQGRTLSKKQDFAGQ